MIDTIKLNYYSNDYIDLGKYNTDFLFDCSFNINKDTGEIKYIKGKLNNFTVYVSNRYINIEGSLTKFILFNNYHIIDLPQIKNAISKLNDLFNLDIGNSYITKLHTGFNIETNFNIEQIENSYLDLPYYEKSILNNETQLLFKNKKNAFTIYDKKLELSEVQNYEVNTPNNLLRFEARYNKRVNETFCKYTENTKLLANDLYSKGFNNILLNKFMNTHNKINKIELSNNIDLDFNNPQYTTKSFIENHYNAILIKNNEINKVFVTIKNLQKQNKMSSLEASRLRKYYKTMQNKNILKSDISICKEIEYKIILKINEFKKENDISQK